MANGFSLGVLQMMKEITKEATPAYKVEPYGLLASLYTAHSRGVIKNDSYDGHTKTVKVKKKKRFTIQDTDNVPSCDAVLIPSYTEDVVSVGNFRQLAFHIEDEVIAQYDSYASQIIALKGTPNPTMPPATGLMWEFVDTLMTAASALLQSVDLDLTTLATGAIGVNRSTGNNAAQTINIPLNSTNNPLTNGINKLFTDFKLNTMNGKPIVVGGGLMLSFMLNQAAKIGGNQSGLDTRIQAAAMDFWYDQNVPDVLNSANQIVVYEKDAIQIVEYLKYQGFKGGDKKGASTFGTLALPMQIGDQLVPIMFDYQLRYNDCAASFTEYNSQDTVTLQKGYNLILSKDFGLYTIPTDAYKSSDVLFGNRGSLIYNLTNA